MTSPLSSKLDEIRRRLRHLLLLRGSARLLVFIILAILVACSADAWWHIDSGAARAAILTLVALTSMAVSGRLLVYPWLRAIPDGEIAREIQRSRGVPHDAIISSVDFDARDCAADRGAPRLQRAVIEQQALQLSMTDASRFIRTTSVQRAVGSALAVCVLAAGALLADRPRASLALHRLFVPLSAPDWPRQHVLRLLDGDFQPLSPSEAVIVPAGRERTFYVDDAHGRLPEQIVLQTWRKDGRVLEQELQARDVIVDVQATRSRRLAAFTLPVHEGEAWLRAVGGDDDRMPWHFARRVAPPDVSGVRVTTHPPDYARQPVRAVNDPVGTLEVLIGSVIELQLSSNKPVTECVLRREARPDQTLPADQGAERPYSFAWDVREAGSTPFWFELVDQHGLQNFPVTRYEVLAVEDREPVVSIEHPPAGATLTPEAVVPFRCVAEDDVGLTRVQLLFSDPPGSEETQLYPLPAVEIGALRADVETDLSMRDLNARPGAQFHLRAEAFDACDLGPAHVGRSARHTVLIVTPEEKRHELLTREFGIAESMQRVVDLQSNAVEQTRQLRLQWQHTSGLRPQDHDLLSRVMHDNSRMQVELFDERRGAAARVAGIRDELDWNRIQDDDVRHRLNLISTELQRLREDSIPVLLRSLATARKLSTATDSGDTSAVDRALAAAESMQVDIAETLQMLLGHLRNWRERYDLLRSLGEITDDQERLTAETTAFGQPLLERDSLEDQDKADFARLADRHQRLATRLADIVETAIQSATDDPRPSPEHDDLSWMADALQQSGVHETMVHVAELLRGHNVGEAMTTQAELVDALRSLTESLDQRGLTQPETLLKQLDRADAELESLHTRQDEVRGRAANMAAAATPEELRQLRSEQQQLAEQTAGSALRLRKQNMPAAAARSARAAEAMRAAARGLQDEISDPTLRRQQQALDELQRAREELAGLRQSLEWRFALQQAGELSATLEAYRDRQFTLRDQARDLADVLQQAGRLRRAQLSALIDLKRSQSDLADDVAALATDVDGMPAFRIVLDAAVNSMQVAVERLTPDRLPAALQVQTTAGERLTEIIDALSNGRSANPTAGSPGESPGDARTGQVDWTLIAQIRVLQGMQARIAGRITELTRAASPDVTLNGEQQRELDELISLQGQAAQVAENLIHAALGEAPDPDLMETVP